MEALKCSAELGPMEEQGKRNKTANSPECTHSTEAKVIHQQQNSHERSRPCQLKYSLEEYTPALYVSHVLQQATGTCTRPRMCSSLA